MNERHFVRVSAPTRREFAKLQKYDFDLFGHTARRAAKGKFTIDGLLTAEQAEQLRQDGYGVSEQPELAVDLQAANNVIELPDWLAERGF